MFIDSLAAGEKIHIRVEKGNNTMEFITEAIQLTSEVDLLAIQQQEKKLHAKVLPVKLITDAKAAAPGKSAPPISFPEGNIIYKVSVVKDKTPYLWRRITIRRLNQAPYHLLVSAEDAEPTERRAYQRISLGLEGTARFLNGAGTLPITIKNISGGGIGIVLEAGVNPGIIKPGSLIQDVTFYDNETEDEFVLSAFVIRTTKYTNGRTLYGCRLNSKTTEVSSYVNHKLYLKQEREG